MFLPPKKYQLLACIIFLICGLESGCKLFDRPEKLPAYITFKDPLVLVDSVPPILNVPAGAKDMWVYKGDEFLGVFPFPSTIPITDFDNAEYTMEGGIFESGLSAFRIPYPFWKPMRFTVNSTELDTNIFTPQFEYFNDSFIVFNFIEDFENVFFKFAPIITIDSAQLSKASVNSFEGNNHAIAYFDSTHKLLSITSDPLPEITRNVPVFAEITFRSSFYLTVGMYYLAPQVRQVPAVTLYPKTEWTTVYVNLIDIIKRAPTDDPTLQFRLWLYSDGLGGTGTVEIDHIRIVHQK